MRSSSSGGIVTPEAAQDAAKLWRTGRMVHIPDAEIPGVFAQFRRVLRAGGPLLIGFHVGDGTRLKTEGYGGHPMNVHVHRRRPSQMTDWLREAGFTVQAELVFGLDESRPGAMIVAVPG